MSFETIPIVQIDAAPYQPRATDDLPALEQLASSIKELGLLQPIVVMPKGDRYILIAGSRRLQAVRMLGWAEVPANVQPPGTADLTLMSLSENLSRENLNPMEVAKTVHHLLTELNLSRVEVARVFGYDPRWVGEQLKLLEMPQYLQEATELAVLSKSVALELDRIQDDHLKEMYVAYAATGGCTLKTANEWVRQAGATVAARERRQEMAVEAPPQPTEPPPAPETPRCWICQAPDTKVMLETIPLCWHCRSALEKAE